MKKRKKLLLVAITILCMLSLTGAKLFRRNCQGGKKFRKTYSY